MAIHNFRLSDEEEQQLEVYMKNNGVLTTFTAIKALLHFHYQDIDTPVGGSTQVESSSVFRISTANSGSIDQLRKAYSEYIDSLMRSYCGPMYGKKTLFYNNKYGIVFCSLIVTKGHSGFLKISYSTLRRLLNLCKEKGLSPLIAVACVLPNGGVVRGLFNPFLVPTIRKVYLNGSERLRDPCYNCVGVDDEHSYIAVKALHRHITTVLKRLTDKSVPEISEWL